MPCTNYHFFLVLYHCSLYFIGESLFDMCLESSPPRISLFHDLSQASRTNWSQFI